MFGPKAPLSLVSAVRWWMQLCITSPANIAISPIPTTIATSSATRRFTAILRASLISIAGGASD